VGAAVARSCQSALASSIRAWSTVKSLLLVACEIICEQEGLQSSRVQLDGMD
jgi:hypothetical protein